jgi:putative two-component system response regulator
MATILVVDDDPDNRKFLATLLASDRHRVLEASDGKEALVVSRSNRPDLVISDVLMPTMDGYEFVRQLRASSELARTPVIFWTATYLEQEAHDLARECGVYHLLSKPCEVTLLLRTVKNALEPESLSAPLAHPSEFKRQHLRLLTNKLSQQVMELEIAKKRLEATLAELAQTYDATLEGWVRALDMRDHETEGHTQRVTDLTVHLAETMGITGDELVSIRRGALLHDIGKIGIPDSILLKPGRLDEEEWKQMRLHPVHALEMLEPIPFLRTALDIPFCHHEKWDGTGYPRGLKGEHIPIAARIFAVVDVWDALCSSRPYKEAWPERRALDHLREQSGKHFDPQALNSFLRVHRQISARVERN